jgi:hypothetical protein
MRELTILSDKYFIESLHKDIRVWGLGIILTSQSYTLRLILRREPPSLELWKFAVHYSLGELAQYCESHRAVFKEILAILRDPSRGLQVLFNDGIPMTVLTKLTLKLSKHSCNCEWGCDACKRLQEWDHMRSEAEKLEKAEHISQWGVGMV